MGEMTVLQKQEIAKGAEAMGAIVGRYARRKSEKVISPLGTLSLWGKLLAVVAAGVLVAAIGMILMDASSVSVDRGQVAVVARDTVNIRQSPSTTAAVLFRARSGDRFKVAGGEGNWTRVRSSDGKVGGWIASALIETRTSGTLNVRYEMKGYFTMALLALVVVFFALRMKKVPAQATSPRKGNETLLMDNR